MLVLGNSRSTDRMGATNYGDLNIWLVKLAADPVGVAEHLGSRELQLCPNPSVGALTIRTPFTIGQNANWTIYDEMGKALLTGTDNTGSFELDGKELAPGHYVFSIICNGVSVTAPFVKH